MPNTYLQKLIESSRNKTFSLLVSTIVVTLILFLIAVKPTLDVLADKKGQILSGEQLKIRLQTKLDTILFHTKKISSSSDKIQFLNKIFATAETSKPIIMSSLVSQSSTYNLKIKEMNFADSFNSENSKVENVLHYKVLQTNLGLSGSLSSFQEFVKSLENSPIIFDITNINIDNTSSPQSGSYSFNVTMVSYFNK